MPRKYLKRAGKTVGRGVRPAHCVHNVEMAKERNLAEVQHGGFVGLIAPFARGAAARAIPFVYKTAVTYTFVMALRAFMIAMQALAGLPEEGKRKYLRRYLRYFFSQENLLEAPLQSMIANEVTQSLHLSQEKVLKDMAISAKLGKTNLSETGLTGETPF